MSLLTQEQLEQYWDAIENSDKPDNHRTGQWLFNTLYQLYPEYADTIRSTHVDPFYDNKKIWPFISHLAKSIC